MPIVKITDFVGYYRHLAASSDIHALSGRGDDRAATEFTNARILEALEPAPDDALLDIGCGDGCLLRMAGGGRRVGLVPNLEEQQKLEAALPGITFLVGVAESLPLESESFSKIVCNSVLLLLRSENAVIAALKEIARVARTGARIWVGEIPAADELSAFGKYKGSSVSGLIWHQFREGRARGALSSVRAVVAALAGRQTLVLCSANIFHAAPEKFIEMAQLSGLQYVSHFKYKRLGRSGEVAESPFRYNYVFVK